MFEILRNVASHELPGKTEYIPGKDIYLFDVSEMLDEEGNISYLFSAVVVPCGTPEQAALREIKFQRLGVLTVVVDGDVYDADTEARSDMTSKLAASGEEDTFPWKLHDNTWKTINTGTLKDVLKTAIEAAGLIRKL